MYKKMLVLLDGSNLAEGVFSYAQELSGRLSIDLELLHVCSPQEAEQLPLREAYVEHRAEELRKKAEEIRAKYKYGNKENLIKAKGTVLVGYPAEKIIKYINANDIDIVMLSTHGRSGVRAWDLGEVANKVIHATKIPIWLVPAELREEIIQDKLPMRPVVIPLDGSKPAEDAIIHAINILKQRDIKAEIILLNVFSPSKMLPMEKNEEKRLAMEKYLDEKVQFIKNAALEAKFEIILGDPARAILKYMRDNPPQLIVMATRAHTGISRMVFGSVTENVLHSIKKTPMFLVGPQ